MKLTENEYLGCSPAETKNTLFNSSEIQSYSLYQGM